jgi:hypothetical protein
MNRAARFIASSAARRRTLSPVSDAGSKKDAHALVNAAPDAAANKARRDVIG